MTQLDGAAFPGFAAEAEAPTDYDGIEQALRAYAPNIQLEPGERTGGALPRQRGKFIRRALVLIGMAGAGAAVYSAPDYWLARWTDASALVNAALEQVQPAPHRSSEPAAPPPPTPAQDTAAAAPPQAPPAPPVTEITSERALVEAALPPAAVPADQPTAKPAREAPADPLRKRAEAAGLNPDLSRTLLAELSDSDFRNARTAIKTALAETPDTQDYIWPAGKAAKPGLAVFTVTFVQGADAGCRRYVVTIAKKGWLTTAPAMETCGTARKAG